MSPARERKIRGEALTTALSATLEFSFKISEVDNEGIFAFSGYCQEEIGAVQSSNLGCFFLRDLATLVPVDGSRETHFVGLWLLKHLQYQPKFKLGD